MNNPWFVEKSIASGAGCLHCMKPWPCGTVIETSSGLVGVGYDGVFTSNDGERWIPEPGAPGEGNGVARAPQGLVVVGSGIWFERSAR